jgi:hypothetical protein
MSRKGAFIGGSTVVQLSSLGGPDRSKKPENLVRAAFPRSGGVQIVVRTNKLRQQSLMAHIGFKKFRRRTKNLLLWLPFIPDEHRQTKMYLARIKRRVEELACLEYDKDIAAEAHSLAKKYYLLLNKLGRLQISRAKFAQRTRHHNILEN